MKTTLPILFTYFCFLSFNLVAQNLVSNPSFEIANKLPKPKASSINRANNWMAPRLYSDYYYKGTGRRCGTPKNYFGRQIPRTGDAYAGICTRRKYIEYLETKLAKTLVKGEKYLIEFHISKAERSMGSLHEIGVLFSEKTIWNVTTRGIDQKPQVILTNPNGYKDKKNWVKLSAVYTAEGGENDMIIGFFNYDKDGKKYNLNRHYYVDDVSLTVIKEAPQPVVTNETTEEESTPITYAPEIGETVALKNIFFTVNESELLAESFPELDKLVQFLQTNNNTSILISGHTDNTGNEDHNKTLSEARAKSIAVYLASKGIDQARIKFVGYGSSAPIASNETDAGKQQNRRVEFIISED